MDTQPLLQSLRDLTSVHEICITHTEELIAALAAADIPAMKAAVVAHSAALQSIDQAEMRRRLAVRGLAYSLAGGSARDGAIATLATSPQLTFTVLLRALPPEDAAPLVEARRILLTVVLQLQLLQRRAATLAHSGQTVVQRTMRAVIGTHAAGYDTTGEQAVSPHGLSSRQGRWA